LIDAATYIGASDAAAARRFVEAAQAAATRLVTMPEAGGEWQSTLPRLAGLRVWPVTGFESYLMFYRVRRGSIEISRLLHGARDIEGLLSQ
jgi:toxin ParE1/3/4